MRVVRLPVIEEGRVIGEDQYDRPRTRGDCQTLAERLADYEQICAERHAQGLSAPDFPQPTEDGFNAARPCPFVSCRHHLLLDVNSQNGHLVKTVDFDEDDDESVSFTLHARQETCLLDAIGNGKLTQTNVAELLNVSQERVLYIERRAMARARGRGLSPG